GTWPAGGRQHQGSRDAVDAARRGRRRPVRPAVTVAQADGVNLVPAGHLGRCDVELDAVGLEAGRELDFRDAPGGADGRGVLALPDLDLRAVEAEGGHALHGARVVRLVDEDGDRYDRLRVLE